MAGYVPWMGNLLRDPPPPFAAPGRLLRALTHRAAKALPTLLAPGEAVWFQVPVLHRQRPTLLVGTASRVLLVRPRLLGAPGVATASWDVLGGFSFGCGSAWGTIAVRRHDGEGPLHLTLRAVDIPPLAWQLVRGVRSAQRPPPAAGDAPVNGRDDR